MRTATMSVSLTFLNERTFAPLRRRFNVDESKIRRTVPHLPAPVPRTHATATLQPEGNHFDGVGELPIDTSLDSDGVSMQEVSVPSFPIPPPPIQLPFMLPV